MVLVVTDYAVEQLVQAVCAFLWLWLFVASPFVARMYRHKAHATHTSRVPV